MRASTDPSQASSVHPSLSIEVRTAGHRIALDDGGAGYPGLTRILELRPDVVKLDRAIIAGIDTDPVRQAMVTAAVAFVAGVGTGLVAEKRVSRYVGAEWREPGQRRWCPWGTGPQIGSCSKITGHDLIETYEHLEAALSGCGDAGRGSPSSTRLAERSLIAVGRYCPPRAAESTL